MNERKTKGLTNLNSDEKIIRDTCVSLARMYFSQFAAIPCFLWCHGAVFLCIGDIKQYMKLKMTIDDAPQHMH